MRTYYKCARSGQLEVEKALIKFVQQLAQIAVTYALIGISVKFAPSLGAFFLAHISLKNSLNTFMEVINSF